MSTVLKDLEPYRVFKFFEEICQIPHGSGNVREISNYCISFAKERKLFALQDEMYNVIIKKPASAGMEALPSVILQGHLDMVCEKNADVDFDFEKDGLRLAVDGDEVHAQGTTLGGDDGIAVAMALAILDDDTLPHPALEVLFTTEEETGMDGASHLDCSKLSSKYMINIDSEEEGVITAGCAGGLKSHAVFKADDMDFEGIEYELAVSGLAGGHSGAEIHIGRANANKLLGRLLFSLRKEVDFGLIEINGGAKDNAIAREGAARIVIPEEQCDLASQIIDRCRKDIQNEYRVVDKDICIALNKKSSYKGRVQSFATAEKIIYLLFNSPYGVQSMSADLPGLVESSLNLGVVRTKDDEITLTWAVRSSVKSRKWLINDQLLYMTEMLGGDYTWRGDYPEWAYRPESPLRTLAVNTYEKMFGKKPVVSTIHAGLECGLFSEKMPDVDMISIGPDLKDIHTPNERLSISSTKRTFNYICEMLRNFKL